MIFQFHNCIQDKSCCQNSNDDPYGWHDAFTFGAGTKTQSDKGRYAKAYTYKYADWKDKQHQLRCQIHISSGSYMIHIIAQIKSGKNTNRICNNVKHKIGV